MQRNIEAMPEEKRREIQGDKIEKKKICISKESNGEKVSGAEENKENLTKKINKKQKIKETLESKHIYKRVSRGT